MIPDTWSSLQSSNLDSMKYDAATQELHVRFIGGTEYIYEGVPPEDAEELYHSSSPGGFMHSSIIGTYEHRRA